MLLLFGLSIGLGVGLTMVTAYDVTCRSPGARALVCEGATISITKTKPWRVADAKVRDVGFLEIRHKGTSTWQIRVTGYDGTQRLEPMDRDDLDDAQVVAARLREVAAGTRPSYALHGDSSPVFMFVLGGILTIVGGLLAAGAIPRRKRAACCD